MELDKIYNVDCMEGIKTIEDKSIDLILTDPPYELEMSRGGQSKLTKRMIKVKSELNGSDLTNGYNIENMAKEIKRIQKHINAYFFCSKAQIPEYLRVYNGLYKCHFYILSWIKANPSPLFNWKYLNDTEYCLYFFEKGHKLLHPATYDDAKQYWITPLNKKDKDKYGHPTCKPVDILQTLIRNSSNEGDIILDPFMGSGSSAVAAKKENRHFIGFEINETYYNTSIERLNDTHTSKELEIPFED